jgi:hypothetical protein
VIDRAAVSYHRGRGLGFISQAILSPEQVNKKVRALRENGVPFLDTVPEASPPLDSPCDL